MILDNKKWGEQIDSMQKATSSEKNIQKWKLMKYTETVKTDTDQ